MLNRERRELVSSMVQTAQEFRRDGWACRRAYGLDKHHTAAVAARGRARGLMIAARLIKGLGTGARVVNVLRRAA